VRMRRGTVQSPAQTVKHAYRRGRGAGRLQQGSRRRVRTSSSARRTSATCGGRGARRGCVPGVQPAPGVCSPERSLEVEIPAGIQRRQANHIRVRVTAGRSGMRAATSYVQGARGVRSRFVRRGKRQSLDCRLSIDAGSRSSASIEVATIDGDEELESLQEQPAGGEVVDARGPTA